MNEKIKKLNDEIDKLIIETDKKMEDCLKSIDEINDFIKSDFKKTSITNKQKILNELSKEMLYIDKNIEDDVSEYEFKITLINNELTNKREY